jgi:hypothetical protein
VLRGAVFSCDMLICRPSSAACLLRIAGSNVKDESNRAIPLVSLGPIAFHTSKWVTLGPAAAQQGAALSILAHVVSWAAVLW